MCIIVYIINYDIYSLYHVTWFFKEIENVNLKSIMVNILFIGLAYGV